MQVDGLLWRQLSVEGNTCRYCRSESHAWTPVKSGSALENSPTSSLEQSLTADVVEQRLRLQSLCWHVNLDYSLLICS